MAKNNRIITYCGYEIGLLGAVSLQSWESECGTRHNFCINDDRKICMNKRERLVADGNQGIKPILFYKPQDEWGEFSQFSRHNIWLINPWIGKLECYATGEHRFQALKGKTEKAHNYIRDAIAPSAAKSRGGPGKTDLREDWGNSIGCVCWYAMLEVCIAKTMQHEDVADSLSQTEDSPIYEDSEVDDIWGWRYRNDYRGKNLLGQCWMHTRHILKAYI